MSDTTTTPETNGLWRFGAIWIGQLVSIVGSALSTFVLGVWVYQSTGSVTQFALISFFAVIPGLLVSPFAGVVADRFDRRRVMIIGDVGAGASTAVIATLIATDSLSVWHIYVMAAVTAGFNTFHLVAYNSMIPAIVGKKHLGRINGLMQITQGVQIAAPLVAAGLLALVGLLGVVIIDLGTMVVAVLTLILTRLPRAATRPVGADGPQASVREDIAVGLRYLRSREGLLGLVLVFGVFNFLFALAGGLVQPLILSFANPSVLGVLMFAGGSGLFVGSLVMAAWGGPKRRMAGVHGGLLLGGVALFLHGLAPSPWLIGIVAPLFLFTLPLLNTVCITLFQTKVRPAVIGRVMATVRMIAMSAVPLAFLVAGPLADRVFEPAMADGGALAGSIGSLIGTGDGRGIALLFMVVGVLLVGLGAVTFALPRVRRVDDLPDELGDAPAAPPAEPAADVEADALATSTTTASGATAGATTAGATTAGATTSAPAAVAARAEGR